MTKKGIHETVLLQKWKREKDTRSVFFLLCICFCTYRSILFNATTKGHFFDFRRFILSMVWGSSPCIMSMTSTAISQTEEPRFLRLLKDSWPGVSMINRPGIFSSLSANCKCDTKKFISSIWQISVCCTRVIRIHYCRIYFSYLSFLNNLILILYIFVTIPILQKHIKILIWIQLVFCLYFQQYFFLIARQFF